MSSVEYFHKRVDGETPTLLILCRQTLALLGRVCGADAVVVIIECCVEQIRWLG